MHRHHNKIKASCESMNFWQQSISFSV